MWERFSYGIFDRVYLLLFVGFLTWIFGQMIGSVTAPLTLTRVGTAGLAALSYLTLFWFLIMRWTDVIVDERGVRLQLLAFTVRKIGWSEIAKVRRASIGRGFTTIDILAGGAEGKGRVRRISILSDIGEYDRIGWIVSQKARAIGFPLFGPDEAARLACRTDDERRAYAQDGARVERL